MWAPGPDGYSRRDEKAFGELIESAMIAGLIVDTAGLPKN
jgi:hypothetical protein